MAKKHPRTNGVENLVAAALDYKSTIDDISSPIKKILAQAMREGWPAEKLANHPTVQLLMTARALSTAILEPDSGKSLAAIKDLKDRTVGKPTEKVETTHKHEKLPDEQLDAMLLSKLRTMEDIEEEDADEEGGLPN